MLQSRIEAAEAYERLMVPALFAGWAPQVAEAGRLAPGQRVLDLACGTGVLAREAAKRVGGQGIVSGVDPNPGMLDVARRLTPQVGWHQAAAESLPFDSESFDAVVSQFGLMFFTDRRAAIRETLRVLRPNGRLAFAVWDALEANQAYEAEIAILQRIAGARAAQAIRAPFELGDAGVFSALFQEEAEISEVNVATVQGVGRFPSVRVMVEADLRGWLPAAGIVLSEDEISEILAEAEQGLSEYVEKDGTVVFTTSAHLLCGRKPAG